MIQVKKRNNKIVGFDERKIESAIKRAFLSEEISDDKKTLYSLEADESAKEIKDIVVNKIKKEYKKEEIVSVENIQDIVEDTLMKSKFKDVAKSYIKYRQRRRIAREGFLKEQPKLIREIEGITFKESKENDKKRENANIDGNTSMGTMLQYGSAISEQFAKTHIVSKSFSKAHESGEIHMHDLNFLAMGTTTCIQTDLAKLFDKGFYTGHGYIRSPQSISSYADLSAIIIQANQNEQHGGQSINAFDFYLAPGVIKTFRKELIRQIKDLVSFACSISDNTHNLENLKDVLEEKIRPVSINIEKESLVNLIKEIAKLDEYVSHEIAKKAYKNALEQTEKETYQAMESLVHNLNTMNSRAGSQVPFSSLNFGTDTSPEGRLVTKNLLLAVDTGLGKGETAIFPNTIFKVKEGVNYNPGDKNYDLFKLAMKVSAKRLFPTFSFLDAPFNAEHYKEGDYHSEVAYMGCRTRVMSNIAGPSQSTSRGNLSFTSINLPRLGIKHGLKEEPDMKGFYTELEESIELVKDQLLERYDYQCNKRVKNFPFLMGQGLWLGSDKLKANDTLKSVLKHGTLSVGFIGLAECLKALTGEHHGESEEAQKLGLEIIGFMRGKLDEYTKEYELNFSLIGTPAESLSGRFVKLDKELYGEIEGVTDKDYYTNSFHLPVYYETTAFNKISKEAPYHELTNAGHISYVELDGDPLDNLEAYEKIIRAMKEAGIGYGAINHSLDTDPVCGYSGIIKDTCPSCGRKEKPGAEFERIRRITGYLVGTLDRFNDSKKAEVNDRVKHM